MTGTRQAICNEITHHLIECASFNPEANRAWVEQQLRHGDHTVEVAGDDYPQHWMRYEGVNLSESEIAYCLKGFDQWQAEDDQYWQSAEGQQRLARVRARKAAQVR